MSNYHVRISVEGERHDEVKNDMDSETLERQILEPYRTGEPITINGKTLTWDKVDRVRISVSDERSSLIVDRLKAEDRSSAVAVLGGPGYDWRAASRAEDVTDQFITGPPGSMRDAQKAARTARATSEATYEENEVTADPGAVFLVAGRDAEATAVVKSLLRSLGLRVVEWEHAVAKTGLPNPYVGDVVEAGLRMAGAAVVLLTPDDLVQLREDLIRDDDGPEERGIQGQARPNVYYEAGVADATGRERTVIMEIGRVKSFSDASGRHVVRYDGSAGKRHALAERLKLAGLDIDTGGQDWLTVGDVESVVAAAENAFSQSTSTLSPPPIVDRSVLIDEVDAMLETHNQLSSRAQHDDLSDLPNESMELTFRAQALIDRIPGNSSYAVEAERVREMPTHVRLPVLIAVLRAIHRELAK